MKLTKRGPNTITSKKALREELDAIVSSGLAVDDQELASGFYAISAPVRNEARQVVAAVNLAAQSTMISLEELVDALSPHLISTADRVSPRSPACAPPLWGKASSLTFHQPFRPPPRRP